MRVRLPAEYSCLRVGELIEAVFPEDEEHRSRVEAMFDLVENPDLPEIYSVILDAFSQRRFGHCILEISSKSSGQIDLSDMVTRHLDQPEDGPKNGPSYPTLEIWIDQEYRALDYAVEQGCWDTKQELLEWLQSLTLLYFLDKHEDKLSVTPMKERDQQLAGIVDGAVSQNLMAQNLIASEEFGVFTITESGRQVIGRLISETESYIAQFDLFKDVLYHRNAGVVEFETGKGEDLRVQVFLAEGLDPVRLVFLLCLYDGTFDDFLPAWRELIHQPEFFNQILEPVVNRHQVDDSMIGGIVESGYAHLAEREDTIQEQRLRQEILDRLKAH